MMSSTMETPFPLMPLSSSPKKIYKGCHTNGPPTWQRGPTKKQVNKKMPKSGKPRQRYRKRRNNKDPDRPKHNMLLHRLSLPCSPPLLERIGGIVEDEDEVVSTLTDSERAVSDIYTGLSFPATPHFYTPEPGEVERFLESVIGAPPPPPSPPSHPSGPAHTFLGNEPSLALETHNLPVDHHLREDSSEDSFAPVLYFPTQIAVNTLPSALDHYQQSPLLGDTMLPPSATTLEECRKRIVPVLLALAQASGKSLDAEQCLQLVSDNLCKDLFRKAKEMKLQLTSLVSQKTPANQGWSGSLKRDRVDDVNTWVRNTRSRFDSVNTVVSDASRRDSDITLVDFPGGKVPPRAPRAMLASQGTRNKSLGEAPCEALVASPTTAARPAQTSLIELLQQAIKMFPALVATTSEPVTENIDTSSVPVGTSTGEESGQAQVASPTNAPSSPTDFISHLPTQPGIWFRQQGRQYAEIVDVDIDVSDEMFYISQERLRMHLRLCSVPVGAASENKRLDTPVSLQDIDGVIERHALHWPQKGKLVVQVNPESERSKTWLPFTLTSDPLDVTSCMRPGRNIFRFIQLSDLSEFTFVLAASPPPPEEEWRSWDWASLVGRSSHTGADTTMESSATADDPMNDLSEFACIPVTVRS